MVSAEEVLAFWFGTPETGDSSYQTRRKLWFGKNSETDQTIRDRFLTTHEQAASGQLDDWQRSPESCLALIVLLDQFPRNMFRNTARMFATDYKALAVAKGAIARGDDQKLLPLQRMFVYLPLEHSEVMADQNQSVALFEQLQTAHPEISDVADYALRHRAVIERFGRFPHRNAILGRPSTLEEIEFLKQPGSSF